jgi:hypothetical protein
MIQSSARQQWGFVESLLDRIESITTLLVPQNGLVSVPDVLQFLANLIDASRNDAHWWRKTRHSYHAHRSDPSTLKMNSDKRAPGGELEPLIDSIAVAARTERGGLQEMQNETA